MAGLLDDPWGTIGGLIGMGPDEPYQPQYDQSGFMSGLVQQPAGPSSNVGALALLGLGAGLLKASGGGRGPQPSALGALGSGAEDAMRFGQLGQTANIQNRQLAMQEQLRQAQAEQATARAPLYAAEAQKITDAGTAAADRKAKSAALAAKFPALAPYLGVSDTADAAILQQAAGADVPGLRKPMQVGNDIVDPVTMKPLYRAPFAPQQPDRTLVEVYDPNSPTGTKFVSREQAIGQPGKAPAAGIEQTVTNPDGTVTTFKIGGPAKGAVAGGDTALTKPNVTDAQKTILEGQDALATLDRGMASWNPSMNTAAGQLKQYGLSWKAYLSPEGKLPPDQQKAREDYINAAGNISNVASDIIHNKYGANFTVGEQKRAETYIPNPATDDPVAFKAKVDNTRQYVQQGIRRRKLALLSGIDVSDVNNLPKFAPIDKTKLDVIAARILDRKHDDLVASGMKDSDAWLEASKMAPDLAQ